MYKVSIIIPTYKDWQRLSLCLNALAAQSYNRDLFEIIVVNNAPGDDAPESLVIPGNCQIINETKPGSYAARNSALKIARSEVVGFTDSDCIPDKDWIKNAVAAFEKDKDITRIGGRIKVFTKDSKPTIAESYDLIYAFKQDKNVKEGLAVTANFFTYRSVFDEVGYFNDNTMSGGDFEWGKRAKQAGLKIIYADNVIVRHPARDSLNELFKKAKRVGKGQVVLMKQKDKTWDRFVDVIKMIRPKTWEVTRIFKQGKEMPFLVKVNLVILRHLLLWTNDYYRISTRRRNHSK